MFSIFTSVVRDFQRFFSPQTKPGRRNLALLFLLVVSSTVIGRVFFAPSAATPTEQAAQPVTLLSLSEQSSSSTFSVIGTVRAAAEVTIESEATGRVTAVPVTLGQSVAAGSVIARLANDEAYANLLQAEGAYEAALANAASSEITVTEANNALRTTEAQAKTTLTNVLNTLRGIFYNDLDPIFADPDNTYRTPGSLTGDNARAFRYLRDEYDYFSEVLPNTRVALQSANSVDDIVTRIDELRSLITRLETLANTFTELIAETEEDDSYEPTEQAYLSTLARVQATLANQDTTLVSTAGQLRAAIETVNQAEIGGTSAAVSAANAQVKQALGRLRAAQSAYEKTIIRSPIDGVVAALPVSLGDNIRTGGVVAEVSNQDALEVTAYVSERDRVALTVGDSVSFISGGTGTITAIAPAIDRATGKIEVRITTTAALTAGESVRVSFTSTSPTGVVSQLENVLTIPLNAVKFQGEQAVVFTVNAARELEAQPVVLGRPRGAAIEITSGLAGLSQIVADARGLVAGTAVSINE